MSGFNCYSCPGAVSVLLGAPQNAIGTSDKQIGFCVFGILILYGLIQPYDRMALPPWADSGTGLHKIPTPK